jgi:hypothetical protein
MMKAKLENVTATLDFRTKQKKYVKQHLVLSLQSTKVIKK